MHSPLPPGLYEVAQAGQQVRQSVKIHPLQEGVRSTTRNELSSGGSGIRRCRMGGSLVAFLVCTPHCCRGRSSRGSGRGHEVVVVVVDVRIGKAILTSRFESHLQGGHSSVLGGSGASVLEGQLLGLGLTTG